jgi:hypothetical protein
VKRRHKEEFVVRRVLWDRAARIEALAVVSSDTAGDHEAWRLSLFLSRC